MGAAPDSRQRYDLELAQIIPEYHSRSPVVRWLFEKRVKIAAARVSEVAPRRLIDVGCGEGSFLFRYLKRIPPEYHGVEGAPNLKAAAESRGIKVWSFEKTPAFL